MDTILIVEDDENLCRGIAFAFESDGYKVICTNTIADARAVYDARPNEIDLVILDLGLPDGNGIDLCARIRSHSLRSNVAIIMLTACDLETDEVRGLQSGADDYVTKPFSLSVLKARVDALLRRAANERSKDGSAGRQTSLQSGRFRLDLALCKLFVDGIEMPISATEFRLLSFLMQHAGQILTKEQILGALWDTGGNFVDENTLSVNISRLRAKIEADPKKPMTIKTVHGMGYIWVKE